MSSDKRIQYSILAFALAILALVTLACGRVATQELSDQTVNTAEPTAEPTFEQATNTAEPTTEPATMEVAVGTFATGFTSDYALIFVVEEGRRDRIAGYLVVCQASERSIEGMFLGMNTPGLNGNDVEIRDGEFVITNEHIHLEGHFSEPTMIEGRIEGRSAVAAECGVPESDEWSAECGAPTDLVSVDVGYRSFDLTANPCR